jgi:hypothetical protein
MRQLKETTEAQMKSDLEAVRLAKEEAIKAIQAYVEDTKAQVSTHLLQQAPAREFECPQMLTPVVVAADTTTVSPVSLKRKRNDDDDEGGEAEAPGDGMAILDDYPLLETNEAVGLRILEPVTPGLTRSFTAPAVLEEVGATSQPPRKKMKRLASVAAQTVGAVTVGAIATWSALAFS